MSNDPSIFCTVPAGGGVVCAETAVSLVMLAQDCERAGIPFDVLILPEPGPHHRARNTLADHFLKQTKATHHLWVDADVGFDAVETLRMMRTGHPIVAGLYPKKSERPEFASRLVDRAKVASDFTAPALFVGFGHVLVAREVYEKIAAASPDDTVDVPGTARRMHQFFAFTVKDGTSIGEDVYFGNLARAAGFDLRVYVPARCTHVGRKVYELPKVEIPASRIACFFAGKAG